MKIPIIYDGDWYELKFVEADSESQALLKEANSIIKEIAEEERMSQWYRIGGVKGAFTPNQSITIYCRNAINGNEEVYVTLIVPSWEQPAD